MKYLNRQFSVVFASVLFFYGPSASAFEFSLFGSAAVNSGDDSNENFALGELELIAEHKLSDKTSIVADMLFMSEQDEIHTELERFSINRTITSMFEVGIGRYMQPMGLWNHNFSHGSLAQHTATRPLLIDGESHNNSIVPSHLIGVLFRGENESFSYQLAIANADGMDTSLAAQGLGPVSVHSMNNQSPSNEITTVLRLTYRVSDQLELGLLAGNHNYVEIGEGTTLVEPSEVVFEQTFGALDFYYNGTSFYLFGEFYSLDYKDNENLTGVGISANPDSYSGEYYYLQAGYRITDKLTFVTRYESLDFDDAATFFYAQNYVPQTRSILGFNYAIEPSNSIRFQIAEIDPDIGTGDSIATLQWFFYLL